MAIVKYIDNDLRLQSSVDDPEFIQIIINYNSYSLTWSKDYEHGFLSSAAKQQMSVIGTLMPWKQLLLAAGNLKWSWIFVEEFWHAFGLFHKNWFFASIGVCLVIYVACWLVVYWEPVGN